MSDPLRITALAVFLLAGWAGWAGGQTAPTSPPTDNRLQAAADFVRASDKHLHHDQLRRGMTGYGLTVMSGTEVVRFEVEIVSVLRNWRPQRDVILARLSGLGLESSGVVQGMSGSPVYVVDSAGKDRLIGAIAYGWSFTKEPIGGIQPISQMLAVAGVPLPGLEAEPDAKPAALASAGRSGRLDEQWQQIVFNPAKADFSQFGWPQELRTAPDPSAGPQLRPLTTPLMVGGLGEVARRRLGEALAGAGLVPVQSGGASGSAAEDLAAAALAPGSAIAVTLVSGDVDISAVGTTTDVIGQRVLAFGHPMFSNGRVSLPMGPSYVHAVVPSLNSSFKLASAGPVTGELTSDESSAVAGVLGRTVEMIPMRVEVEWAPQRQNQVYNYRLVREEFLTNLLAGTVGFNSVTGLRELPSEHTVEYSVRVDYGDLGVFDVSNYSSGASIYPATSDLNRVLTAMVRNPFARVFPESIAMKIHIREGVRVARLLGMRLDRARYAPGETVTATLDLQRWHGDRFTRIVRIALPGNLAAGQYDLEVGDYTVAVEAVRKHQPHRFDPRDARGLLESLQVLLTPRMDQAHAVLTLNKAGLAVDREPVAGVPPTVEAVLRQSLGSQATAITGAVTVAEDLDFMLEGTARAQVVVQASPPRP